MQEAVPVEDAGLQKKSYRDLEICQMSLELAIEVHKMTLSLPRFEELEEGRQIRRSSKSISATIAGAMVEDAISRNL